MKLLLDTHALLWWSDDNERLGAKARAALTDSSNEILVSAASAYEMTLKFKLGKLLSATKILLDLHGYLRKQGFEELPISLLHGEHAGRLPLDHRDPFDRLLIAQAQIEQCWLVSNEVMFDGFGVRRLW